MQTNILFFNEDCSFNPRNKKVLRNWLSACARREKKRIGDLNYIFCSDGFLKKMNVQYLDHHYLTDIITFPSDNNKPGIISGDIFISIDRIRDNAKTYGVSISNELHRVMAHGLLHLMGYGDKTAPEIATMRKKEEACLRLIR